MSIVIYGGVKCRVEQQLSCDHEWHGPCIDSVSRYYKCTKCFCLERDCVNEEDYNRLLCESGESDDT